MLFHMSWFELKNIISFAEVNRTHLDGKYVKMNFSYKSISLFLPVVFVSACCVVLFACDNNVDEKSVGFLTSVLQKEASKHGFDVINNGELISEGVCCTLEIVP